MDSTRLPSGADPPAAAPMPRLGRGFIESIAEETGSALVLGWHVAFEPTPVVGFAASLDGVALEVVAVQLGGASPDVAALFPTLTGAAHARFGLRARVDARSRAEHGLLQITPRFVDGADALPIVAILHPKLDRPPAPDVDSIGGTYEDAALEFLSYFVGIARIGRQARVLDVGCGIGRIAYGLAAHLDARGSYHGFDVMLPAVELARRTIGARFPRFAFEHVDLSNGMYNPGGSLDPRTIRFPARDASADLVVMTSVITHLMATATAHYIAETGRVLSAGGSAVVSCFLISDESKRLLEEGRSRISFVFDPDQRCWLADARTKEGAVAYSDATLDDWIAAAGLEVRALLLGSWCGRSPSQSFQDVLILRRRTTKT